MNPVLAEEGRRLSDNYDNMNTDIAVTNHGPCYPCHGTLLKDYYRVDMSLCRYTMSRCCNEFSRIELALRIPEPGKNWNINETF